MNWSQDIRTQLNIILGISALRMDDKNLSGDLKEDIKKIKNAGEILLGLFNDLLDVSQTDQKHHIYTELEYADLNEKKALVVDDYQANLDVAARMLSKYKMQVDCVTNGQAAIDLIKLKEPLYDIIFMDYMMSEMDGIQTTLAIRKLDSEYAKTVPIISLTATVLPGSEKLFLDNGFNAFLPKPISILQLDLILKKWIKIENRTIEPESSVDKQKIAAYLSRVPNEQNFPSGMKIDAGMELYAGDVDIYLYAVHSFIRNINESIEKLITVTKDTLQDYAVHIHAVKSMAAAIGAENTRSAASELETLSKTGNLQDVTEKNPVFLDQTRILVSDIKKWLEISDTE